MDPIRKLMDEHRVIEKTLACLPAYAATLGDGSAGRRDDLARFVEFIRRYADTYHHGKEEDMLFTAMVAAGVPQDGGPIAVMLAEHDQGRAFAGVLDAVAEGEGPLTGDEADRVIQAAGGYADLLRNHIEKEDQILYPMAQRFIPAPAMEELGRAFDAYEAEHREEGVRLEEVSAALCRRYA